jgi:hypothetical protein
MRLTAPVLLALVVACGSAVPVSAPVTASGLHPSAPATSVPTVAQAPPAEVGDVEEIATRLGAAWAACDRDAALALSLSYEDVVAMTRKEVDRAEWEGDTRAFMEERCRELGEAHATVVGAKIVKNERHPRAEDPERLKMDVDAVYVQLVFEVDGRREQRGLPLLFLATAHGYRFAAKH